MEAMSQDEDLVNESNNNSFNLEQLATPELIVEQLKNIAESGNVHIEWPELQSALKVRLRNVLDHYIEKSRDCKEEQYQEPNVEKFDLDKSRDEVLDLITSFNEPPFTIQRICELLYSPFKYYDKISTFLRGLEKNLRVISSNNWSKSHVEPPKGDCDVKVPSEVLTEQEQISEPQDDPQPNIQIDTDIQAESASDQREKVTDQQIGDTPTI